MYVLYFSRFGSSASSLVALPICRVHAVQATGVQSSTAGYTCNLRLGVVTTASNPAWHRRAKGTRKVDSRLVRTAAGKPTQKDLLAIERARERLNQHHGTTAAMPDEPCWIKVEGEWVKIITCERQGQRQGCCRQIQRGQGQSQGQR